MTTQPLLEDPLLFAVGSIAIVVVLSYMTVRTLRCRAGTHQTTHKPSRAKLLVVVVGLHLFVMLGSGGILATTNGLPATGNLAVVFTMLGAVYLLPLMIGITLLYWLLTSRRGSPDEQPASLLSLREISAIFAGWNLAIYPSIGVLFVVLT